MEVRGVVFDLDFTLWNCGGTWVDCTRPPYTRHIDEVHDRDGRVLELYPDVLSILSFCDDKGLPMAIASRTDSPPQARDLLSLLGISDRFVQKEIYPGDKKKHIRTIAKNLKLPLENIIFFDDEFRNITSTASIGVKAIHTPDGLNRKIFLDSLTL